MVNEPVLIVDDEVEMRIAMSETLKHCGYPVEISHNAIDAIKKFKQNTYSLVITDMTMPKEFYDWLDQCPLDYIREEVDTEGVVYRFHNWEPNWKDTKEECAS